MKSATPNFFCIIFLIISNFVYKKSLYATNNSIETYAFICLRRAGRFGQKLLWNSNMKTTAQGRSRVVRLNPRIVSGFGRTNSRAPNVEIFIFYGCPYGPWIHDALLLFQGQMRWPPRKKQLAYVIQKSFRPAQSTSGVQ